ncbi:hypothetical protein [Arthrobacter sp. TMN-50]
MGDTGGDTDAALTAVGAEASVVRGEGDGAGAGEGSPLSGTMAFLSASSLGCRLSPDAVLSPVDIPTSVRLMLEPRSTGA